MRTFPRVMTTLADRDALEREAFDSIVGNPHEWLYAARTAQRVAELVYTDMTPREREAFDYTPFLPEGVDGFVLLTANHTMVNAYLFQAATALENLLKGALARRRYEVRRANPDAIAMGRNGELGEVFGHNLTRIADEIGLVRDPDEDGDLRICTTAIGGWGRFPSSRGHRGGVAPPQGFDVVAFRERFERLYWHLDAHVRENASLARVAV